VQTQQNGTLYERLGGSWKIAILVDDFIDRILTDPRFDANPRLKEASRHVSKAGLKYLVTELTCWAAGGPQTYTGRSMSDSHRHLMITDDEWESFMDDFRRSMDACKVRPPEQQELLAILTRSKSAIVVSNGAS
jgi:hemoglobin